LASIKQASALLWLVNDIVQQTRKSPQQHLTIAFSVVLPICIDLQLKQIQAAIKQANANPTQADASVQECESLRRSVLKVIGVWRQRHIFDESFHAKVLAQCNFKVSDLEAAVNSSSSSHRGRTVSIDDGAKHRSDKKRRRSSNSNNHDTNQSSSLQQRASSNPPANSTTDGHYSPCATPEHSLNISPPIQPRKIANPFIAQNNAQLIDDMNLSSTSRRVIQELQQVAVLQKQLSQSKTDTSNRGQLIQQQIELRQSLLDSLLQCIEEQKTEIDALSSIDLLQT
jgi:hypothetical protein